MTEAAPEASEQEVAISPVGIIESPYREKFSVPRQSGLASNVSSRIRILPPYDTEDAFGVDVAVIDSSWKQDTVHISHQ